MENLVSVEPLREGLAGATKDAKGKIVEFAWWLKKQGYRDSTIAMYPQVIQMLSRREADILQPESVKEVISKQETWSINRKKLVADIYTTFLRFLGRIWEPPIYKRVNHLPFIPSETEIDQLIAGCQRKLGTFLQLLKETGMRPGEAWSLKWFNIDSERRTVTVNDPEKSGNARILNVSSQLVSRIELLPKKSEYIFQNAANQSLKNWTINFINRRKSIARRLNNPRLLKISFKTLRHFKGTTEYHKTKDILHVKQVLGHKNIQNTLIYINLESAIFKTVNDEFHVRAAKTVQEAKQLLEVGFEYVTNVDDVKLFRKRK